MTIGPNMHCEAGNDLEIPTGVYTQMAFVAAESHQLPPIPSTINENNHYALNHGRLTDFQE